MQRFFFLLTLYVLLTFFTTTHAYGFRFHGPVPYNEPKGCPLTKCDDIIMQYSRDPLKTCEQFLHRMECMRHYCRNYYNTVETLATSCVILGSENIEILPQRYWKYLTQEERDGLEAKAKAEEEEKLRLEREALVISLPVFGPAPLLAQPEQEDISSSFNETSLIMRLKVAQTPAPIAHAALDQS